MTETGDFFDWLNPINDPIGATASMDQVNASMADSQRRVNVFGALPEDEFAQEILKGFTADQWSFVLQANGGHDDPEAWRQMRDGWTQEQFDLYTAHQNREASRLLNEEEM